MTADLILSRGKELTEECIGKLFSAPANGYEKLIDAMDYSVSSGGKRLRPALLLEFYRLCGGEKNESAAHFAAAIEFIHTYSLIHDDLPCMDNDDMRRGKPSCHIAFGEDTALLAGDALLTMAFYAASTADEIPSENIVNAINVLSHYSGAHGMVGGQVLDLSYEGNSPTAEQLEYMYSLKTGALIVAAAKIGCILANANENQIAAAVSFAQRIGFAFQIVDDILDIVSTTDELGKPVGSDAKNEKNTYASLLGLKEASALVDKLTDEAIDELKVFGDAATGLCELARKLTVRKN